MTRPKALQKTKKDYVILSEKKNQKPKPEIYNMKTRKTTFCAYSIILFFQVN